MRENVIVFAVAFNRGSSGACDISDGYNVSQVIMVAPVLTDAMVY